MNGGAQLYLTPIAVTEGRIDRLLGAALRNDLVWAMRPKLSIDLVAGARSELGSAPPEIASRRAAVERVLRRTVREARAVRGRLLARRGAHRTSPGGPRMDADGGVLRVWGSENQRLAVGADRERSVRLPDVEAGRQQQGYGSDPHVQLGALRDAFPSMVRPIDALLARAVVMQGRVVTALDQVAPRVVVVGSTEHLYTRLMILEARRRGIPSVYVPHAPAATNRIYGDLPADLSLLANVGDQHYYLGLGAAADQMEVVGDPVAPTVVASDSGASGGARIIVFATTADRPPGMLRRALLATAAWVEEAGLPLVVAPHPRDRSLAEEVTRELGLRLHDGRTEQVFAMYDVAVLVTEAASGVALAAVRAGVPVLRWSGVPDRKSVV